MQILLVLFLVSLILQCRGIYELRLERPVIMPLNRSYYQIQTPNNDDFALNLTVPWQRSREKILWDELTLKLYRNNDILKRSVDLLVENKPKEAVSLLESYLDKPGKDMCLLGRINNNLSICYLLLSPSKPKKAKYHIDQAGILLSSPMEVLENVRVITYFLHEELKFHPK